MNLAGWSVFVSLLLLAWLSGPWGFLIVGAMAWLYSRG